MGIDVSCEHRQMMKFDERAVPANGDIAAPIPRLPWLRTPTGTA